MKMDARRGWGIQGQSVIKIDREKDSSCGKWNSRNALEQVGAKKGKHFCVKSFEMKTSGS